MIALAILVVVALLIGLLAFVWYRLAVAPRWGRRWVPWVVAAALAVLTAFALEGFDVWGGQFSPDTMRPIAWIGQAFLAALLYLVLGLFVVWVVDVVLRIALRRRDHGRVARRTVNRIAAPMVVAAAVAAVGYGAWEANQVRITRYQAASPDLPQQFDGMTLALVTDLHAGAVRSAEFTRRAVDLVNAENPDLIVVVGDLVDGTAARSGPDPC